jgi:hypothetical protein
MNRSMKRTQEELEKIAERATALSEWLEDKSLLAASHMPLPTEVVTVTAVVLVTGSIIMMDGGIVPDSLCWDGCSLTG